MKKKKKKKNIHQDYSVQQGSHSHLMEKSKVLTDMQKLRIQHQQSSLTTNAKGTSLDRKHKRKKRPMKTNPKQNKW